MSDTPPRTRAADPPAAAPDCVELVELVTEYLEGTIAAVQAERIEEHLGDCTWCERYVRQTRMLVAALGEIDGNPGHDPESSESWHRALAAFRTARA